MRQRMTGFSIESREFGPSKKGGRARYLEDLHVDRINLDHQIHECVRDLGLGVQDHLRLLRGGFLSQ